MTALETLNSLNEENAIQYHAYSLLHDKIAELEAENAELKTFINYSNAPPKEPTREQVAALVKGLEWKDENFAFSETNHSYTLYYYGEDQYKATAHNGWMTGILTYSEARAAAEAHHIETVLSLLNI